MEQSFNLSWRLPLAITTALVLSACGKGEEASQQMPAAEILSFLANRIPR